MKTHFDLVIVSPLWLVLCGSSQGTCNSVSLRRHRILGILSNLVWLMVWFLYGIKNLGLWWTDTRHWVWKNTYMHRLSTSKLLFAVFKGAFSIRSTSICYVNNSLQTPSVVRIHSQIATIQNRFVYRITFTLINISNHKYPRRTKNSDVTVSLQNTGFSRGEGQ